MKHFKQSAREISYAYSAQTFSGRAFIKILENITVKDKKIVDQPKCRKAVKKANILMGHMGRILVRKSGTEPKIRIMAESNDKDLMSKCIKMIKKSLR